MTSGSRVAADGRFSSFQTTSALTAVMSMKAKNNVNDRLRSRTCSAIAVSSCSPSTQNAAARLRRCDHITDALVSLHWLRVSEKIAFKVAVMQTYRALHGVTLRSTCNSSRAPTTSLLGTDSGPQSPTVRSFLLSDFLLSIAAPFLSLVLVFGTIYRRTLLLLTVAVHI